MSHMQYAVLRQAASQSTIQQVFGIDVFGEDEETVVHHKVNARVTCANS